MSFQSRINKLENVIFPGEPHCKSVEILAEDGPAIEWETPTGLILRVPADCEGNPDTFLTDEQRELINPGDLVDCFCR